MPNPFANVGGGVGRPDDSFLGLDSGNFWSRFGLPEPGGPPAIDTASPMGPVDAMPDSQTPMSELEPTMPNPQEPGAPLDAMYSMIGMSPLTADSMGRYNLTDDQRQSASNHSLANTLGTAAQVMFGTASADDMVKSGLNYGARRDAALDKSSARNKEDYDTKVEMAVKGSNLMRQQVLIEAEQEKLKEIMEQKEYGAEWVATMEPVWEKYANELAATDPDRAKQYAASLQMVRAKALTGDMSSATSLFDAASTEMIPSVWKKNQEEDMVKAQFARAAEFTGFKEADQALQATMPGWRMGMKDGKAVPMSPQDQQRERNAIDVLAAQAQNYREINTNSSQTNQLVRSQLAEQKRINELANDGNRALGEAFAILNTEATGKQADNAGRAKAQGVLQEYTSYLQAAGALGKDPSNWQKEIEILSSSPQALANAIAIGATKQSPVFMQLASITGGASGGQQGGGSPLPAAVAGAGGPQSGPPIGAAQIGILNEQIAKLDINDPNAISEMYMAIAKSRPEIRATATEQLTKRLRGEQINNAYAPGSNGAYRTSGNQTAQ